MSNTSLPIWAPTAQMVADKCRARLVDDGGNKLTVFSDGPNPKATNPTLTEVNNYIRTATVQAIGDFGWAIPDLPGDVTDPTFNPAMLRVTAQEIVAFGAAALVEINKFPEQVAAGNNRSPYTEYKKQFTEGRMSLKKSISEVGNGSTVGGIDDAPLARYGFDCDDISVTDRF